MKEYVQLFHRKCYLNHNPCNENQSKQVICEFHETRESTFFHFHNYVEFDPEQQLYNSQATDTKLPNTSFSHLNRTDAPNIGIELDLHAATCAENQLGYVSSLYFCFMNLCFKRL